MAKKFRQRKFGARRSPEVAAASAVPIPPATHQPWQIAAVCLVIALVTLIAYQNVRHNDFLTCDDGYYVLENQHVHQGVNSQGIAWAFTTFNQGNWHPLTWISHMVDWKLYGSNPSGHHLTNLYLHTVNAVLLFLLLLYMTGYMGRSAMVAFLFALHPAHVESVAWIAECKDVLCAFFFLCTLLAYAWYVRNPSWKRMAWVVCGFACALMSKPMAVTLPFALLLLDYWPLRRILFSPETRAHWLSSLWKLCLEKWPLFIMAILSSVVTFIAQRSEGAVAALQGLNLWDRICQAAISYFRYLRITIWPDPLTIYYYYDLDKKMVAAAMLSLLALAGITAVCWYIRKDKPYCIIGWLWFLGTLVPVIGIVQVGEQSIAERYTYLPFIGLFIAIVWLAGDAVAHSPKIRVATQLLAVALIAACAVKTYAQVKLWKDSVTLFSHTLEVDPRGSLPNLSLGVAYLRLERYAEAEAYFERALDYDPSNTVVLADSALSLIQTNDPRNLPLAGQRVEQALRAAPDDPTALSVMAQWSILMGRPRDGEIYSRKVLAEQPDLVTARLYLANALQTQGKLAEAAQECRQAIAFEPDNYLAHYDYGIILDSQGLKQEALEELRHSLAIKPDQALAYSKIGWILMEPHRYSEAIEAFNQALRLDPSNTHALNGLGTALFQLGDYEKAAEQFAEVVRIDPSDAVAMQDLKASQVLIKTKN
ncbi:MAG: tetratricopeptide repeat protein [Terracidiphilus sp.]